MCENSFLTYDEFALELLGEVLNSVRILSGQSYSIEKRGRKT